MQRLIALLLFILSMSVMGTAMAETNWWQSEWKYRKPITINAGPEGAALGVDVGRAPVLVRLHTGNFAFDGVASGGKDIRFVGSDGKTILNHQIEQIDAELGIATIWVDVPKVSASAPQTIWMYYGNENAPASGNGQLVFDPDYTLIYHFAEPDIAPRDTTAYGNNAQAVVPPAEATVIGRGAQLGTVPLGLPASPSLALAAGGAFTFSVWLKADQLGPNQAIYARREGGNELLIGIDQGIPFVQINGARTNPGQAIAAGKWTHVAVTAEGNQVVLYVGGRESTRLEASLPALSLAASIGADAASPEAAPDVVANGEQDAANASPSLANVFTGAIDEVRVSKVARPAALILADAVSQGSDSRLTAFGEDEQSAGVSHFGFILKAMPVDAWVVVAILGLMLLVSWAIMIAKSRYFGAVEKANQAFTAQYKRLNGAPVSALHGIANAGGIGSDIQNTSTLWKLYQIAIDELKARSAAAARGSLPASSISAIRASMEAEVVRESERMSKRMNWLSTTIEGAPYVGLFGTVIGIMLVFAVAAIAGAVDINSVAPGMAAALLCTAAGLGVAIPALFGYNWLVSRSEAISADNWVFVDELSSRLAEEYDGNPSPLKSVSHA